MDPVSTAKAPPERRVHRDPPAHLGAPAMADAAPSAGAVAVVPTALQGGALSARQVLYFQRTIGNAATGRAIAGDGRNEAGPGGGSRLPARGPTPVVWRNGNAPRVQRNDPKSQSGSQAAPDTKRVAFVREDGLNLRAGADQQSKSLDKLKFGQRLHLLDEPDPQSSWRKVAVPGQTGYVFAPKIHFPPEWLIQKDPGLGLIKVKSGQTFWGLVKSTYGIQGNEDTADLNINHFINAIRRVNKPEAFNIKTGMLDDFGNVMVTGRDASDTYLIAGVDLWIPSFGVAAAMDVGSGTVRGEFTRFYKKIEQKLDDFKTACWHSGKYAPEAIARHVGEVTEGLLRGLVEFALDAAKILAASTAVGALIGALFGGVGALPGAAIGFEIGLIILEFYGLYVLIESVLAIAGDLLSQLGTFVKLVWTANGDKDQVEEAAKTLADALGILASAILIAFVAYVAKKGVKALSETKFAATVGETRLAEWVKQRQQMATTKDVVKGRQPSKPTGPTATGETSTGSPKPGEARLGQVDKLVICRVCDIVPGVPKDLMEQRAKLSPDMRKLLDTRAEKFFPDPAHPTADNFKALRGFMEGTAKKGGGDLEAGLQKLAPKAPPRGTPHGAAAGELPRLRGEIERLIAEIDDFARAHPDRASVKDSATRLRQQLDGPVTRMENGLLEATPEQMITLKRHIKGGQGELDRAKAAPAGTQFSQVIDGVEIDQIRADGTLAQVKKMRALRNPSRSYEETVAQVKRTLEIAQKHPVNGQPRKVVFEFPEGLSKEVKANLEAIEVNGQKATIDAREIEVPPK